MKVLFSDIPGSNRINLDLLGSGVEDERVNGGSRKIR